jgi:hypothetical protein
VVSFFPSSFPANIFYAFLMSPMRATFPTHPILLAFVTLIIFGPVSIAERSKAGTVYDRSNIGIKGSNPAWSMDVCLRVCVLLSCVGRGLASG